MAKVGNIMGPGSSSMLTTPGLHAANLVTVTVLPSGTAVFQYVGKAPLPISTLTLRCNVVTAALSIVWAEVAVFKGPPVVGGSASLTRLGFADVATAFNTVGLKSVPVSLLGVAPGDELWVAIGSQAATPFQLRGMLADQLQSGVVQTAAVRPSLTTTPQAVTLATAIFVPAWLVGKV